MVLGTATATPKRLLAAVVAACLCAAAAATRCPPGCRCSPDGLTASCSDLGDQLPQGLAPTLSTLGVTHHRLRAVDGATFADLPLLQTLDMSRGRITQVSEGAFRGLGRLRQLVLSANWLRSLPEDAFPDSLQQLDLSSNPLSLPADGPFLRADGIASLNLSHCAVADVGDEAFSQLPSLVELDLRGNPLGQLSPLAFLGLRRLYVDEGSMGDSALGVIQVVQEVVQVPRVRAIVEEDFTTELQLTQRDSEGPVPPILSDDPETAAYVDRAPDGGAVWQRDKPVFSDFSVFGQVPQDAADSNLFKGAPFQATGEITVVYASDLKNLKDTLLVLGALAVICFLLAAVQRMLDNANSRGCFRSGGDRGSPCQQHVDDTDNFWWDAETTWWETEKTRSGDMPPPYPYPPTYEDSLTVNVTPNPNYDLLADSASQVSHQPASVHLGRRQPDIEHGSHASHSINA